MSYATLMVHSELGRPNTTCLKIAGDLAERLNASVIGVAVCQPMRIIYNDGYVPGDMIERDLQEIDAEIKAAEAEFRAALGSRAIEWRSAVIYRPLSGHIAQEARSADLIITGVDANVSMFDTSRHVDIGDLVMQAGRPCLIVPATAEQFSLDHAIVGWKDCGETRRAIRDALPLLKLARRVTVIEIVAEEDLVAAHARLDDVVGWLKRHGIDSGGKALPATGDDALTLYRIIEDNGGDVLVAGAYGHSRLREWVWGGVTRDLLLRGKRCSFVSH